MVARQMVRAAMLVIFGVSVLNAESDGTSQNSATNKLRLMLLDTDVKGRPPITVQIQEFIRVGVMDATAVVSILTGWASINLDEADEVHRQLAEISTEVLGVLPSEESRRTLLGIAKREKSNIRRCALRSLVGISPNPALDRDLADIIDDHARFDALDRRAIYEAYTEMARSVTKESKKIQQSVDVIRRLFENETDNSNRIFLDKFLIDRSPDHKVMPLRQEWLTHLKSSKIDAYRNYSRQMSVTNSPHER